MVKPIIRTEKLTKYYGSKRALIDLDLEISVGEVFGFLGPNGAGKTTTIRLLLDLIRPTRGKAYLFGMDSREMSVDIKCFLGYLPGELATYDRLTGRDYIGFMRHLRRGVDSAYAGELAERLDLDLSQPIRSLSHGNKQKIGLVQALMHKPRLVILDEPTQGLDPLIQREFYELIDEAKRNGQTIFLSSHILPEVEHVCDTVGFIRSGKLIDVQNVNELKQRTLRKIEIHFAGPVDKSIFDHMPSIKNVTVVKNVLSCTVIGELDEVIKEASRYEVIDVVSHEPDLEEIFMEYYGAHA